jgi:hypothetical protein
MDRTKNAVDDGGGKITEDSSYVTAAAIYGSNNHLPWTYLISTVNYLC